MTLQDKQWTSNDGISFGFRHWLPSDGSEPSAVLIGVHGLNGSSADFSNLGTAFAASGRAVYAYEMRGQGNDPRPEYRGDIAHPRDWLTDLAAFTALVQKRHPDADVFLYGESLGSLIVTFAVQHKGLLPADIRGIVLASPVLSLNGKLSLWKRLVLQIAATAAPRHRLAFTGLAAGKTEDLMVTSSSSFEESAATTPWLVEKFSLRFFAFVGRMIEQMPRRAAKFEQEVLVLSGDQDVVTAPHYTRDFVRRIPEDLRSHISYGNGHHLLFYDEVSDQVVDDVLNWVVEVSRP